MNVKAAPEDIERAKTLKDMGWTNVKIAKNMDVHEKTVRRWLAKADDPELAIELSEARRVNRERYIDDAWEIVLDINTIVKEQIKKGESGFKNVKDAATVMGIYLDKIEKLFAMNRHRPSEAKNPIQINITPPDGYTVGIVSDTVQVHDDPEPVCSDDSGSGLGENVLRLPACCPDSSGTSGE